VSLWDGSLCLALALNGFLAGRCCLVLSSRLAEGLAAEFSVQPSLSDPGLQTPATLTLGAVSPMSSAQSATFFPCCILSTPRSDCDWHLLSCVLRQLSQAPSALCLGSHGFTASSSFHFLPFGKFYRERLIWPISPTMFITTAS
jgi:hypothetical protein